MTAIGPQPLVSIITPVYNGARYLDELIQSVLRQDYPRLEHIIIDDGSTDDGATESVLKRYSHLRWWSRENKGQYATLNEGIASAQGTILGIIAADDMYVAPSAISSVVNYWQAHPEYGCVYGRTWLVDAEGNHFHTKPIDITERWPIALLRYRSFIPHCSLFVAKEIVISEDVWFDPSLHYAGDWDWIIRLSMSGYKFGYLHQPLSLYREHDAQATQKGNLQRILSENRLILTRYRSGHAVHRLLTYRAQILKGVRIFRARGIPGLMTLGGNWLHRRLVSVDRGR